MQTNGTYRSCAQTLRSVFNLKKVHMTHAMSIDSSPRAQAAPIFSAADKRRPVAGLAWALAFAFAFACAPPVRAQSEASLALSALPVASVAVVGASVGVAGSAVLVAPVVLSAAGGTLVVKTVASTARGSALVLESSLDGSRYSIEAASGAFLAGSVAVGAVVTATALASGTLLSSAGRALAFVPNALGRSLVHNERITF